MKNTAPSTFILGDTVHWLSQAQGRSLAKQGVVAEIVPAGSRPDKARFPQLYKGAGAGMSRKVESYVVVVGTKPYWPHVAPLRKGAAEPGLKVVGATSTAPLTDLKVDEKVSWTSQAGGRTKSKEGVVAQVVQAGTYPDREHFPALFRSSGVGLHRDHVSFVVLVGNKPYWPRAGALSRTT